MKQHAMSMLGGNRELPGIVASETRTRFDREDLIWTDAAQNNRYDIPKMATVWADLVQLVGLMPGKECCVVRTKIPP